MIALDTNILVYAHRAESPFHPAAERIILELSQGGASWAVPWPCVHEFLGIVTHPRIYAPPTPAALALDAIAELIKTPTLVLLAESDKHWSMLRSLVTIGRITGPRVHDARVAAICLEHGVRELWSADRDFSRFPSLNVVNPLLA